MQMLVRTGVCGQNCKNIEAFMEDMVSEKDMTQSYQLFSFMIFSKNSRERLHRKMQNFNREICNQSEKHISQNIMSI